MAVIDPEELFQQAERLIAGEAGSPNQADIRRAISAAYYGIFHATVTAAADLFVGSTNRHENRYGLAYRSVDHAWLRDLCNYVRAENLAKKIRPYAPAGGFGANIHAFAAATVDLQEKRHAADYDVMIHMDRSNADLMIGNARAALERFNQAHPMQREAFLSLLMFKPR